MRPPEKIGVPEGLLLDLICTSDRENGQVYLDQEAWGRFVRGVEAARRRPEGLICHDDGSIEWDGEPIDIPQPSARKIMRALHIHGTLDKWGLMEQTGIESEKTLEYAIEKARLALYENRIPTSIRYSGGVYSLSEKK